MKPTVCLKSLGDNFICSKIILELYISVKHKWIWKQKSNIEVILKCEPVSCESASSEPMSLRVASLRVAS